MRAADLFERGCDSGRGRPSGGCITSNRLGLACRVASVWPRPTVDIASGRAPTVVARAISQQSDEPHTQRVRLRWTSWIDQD
jgi:hypothetical protein